MTAPPQPVRVVQDQDPADQRVDYVFGDLRPRRRPPHILPRIAPYLRQRGIGLHPEPERVAGDHRPGQMEHRHLHQQRRCPGGGIQPHHRQPGTPQPRAEPVIVAVERRRKAETLGDDHR